MKASRKLTTAELAVLSKAREELAKAMARVERAEAGTKADATKLAKLDEEYHRLEMKASKGDSAASVALTGVLDQKVRTAARIEAADLNNSELLWPLRDCVAQGQNLVARTCGVEFTERLKLEVEKALAPFFHEPRRAHGQVVASQTDAFNALGQFLNAPIGTGHAELVWLGGRYLKALDALIAGEDIWTFQSFAA